MMKAPVWPRCEARQRLVDRIAEQMDAAFACRTHSRRHPQCSTQIITIAIEQGIHPKRVARPPRSSLEF